MICRGWLNCQLLQPEPRTYSRVNRIIIQTRLVAAIAASANTLACRIQATQHTRIEPAAV